MSTTHLPTAQATEIDGDDTVIEITITETRTIKVPFSARHLDDLYETRQGITAKSMAKMATDEVGWIDPVKVHVHVHIDEAQLAQAIAGHAAWNAQFAEDED